MMLEQVLEQVLEQKLKYNLENHGVADKYLLYFPRKILKVKKFKSGSFEPRSWFIYERTNKHALSLENETSATGEALTSGLRSAIVKENGEYIKLKGVAPKTQMAQIRKYPHVFEKTSSELPEDKIANRARGSCSFKEAFLEAMYAIILKKDFPVPMNPKFIEATFHFKKEESEKDLKEFLELFSLKMPLIEFKGQGDFDILLNNYKLFYEEEKKYPDLGFVSAFSIKGDTRLDEAFYHLTSKNLRGSKKEIRDQLLIFLSFKSGLAKASLSGFGYSWGKLSQIDIDLHKRNIFTNCHIGNFVIYPDKNGINVGLTDLSGIQAKAIFSEERMDYPNFARYVTREIKEFRNDMNESVSTFPTYKKYKHFSDKLKDKCFNAMYTGYQVQHLYQHKFNEVTGLIEIPKKIEVPKETYISPQDFREKCKEVLS